MLNNIKNNLFLISSLFFILTLIIFSLFIFKSKDLAYADEFQYYYDLQEKDAIALRVLPNPNNYSIERWYKFQGFTGSPQSLLVDGYEAIRDGRTIYVNAANVVDDNLYTNIYLITYTQDPDVKTLDIVSRLIDSWKFNTNLTEPGTCRTPSQFCFNDNACPDGQICQRERCVLPFEDQLTCLIDSTCPSGIYCSSKKAQVIRDVKRLGLLKDIEEQLRRYYQINGNYPTLSAGTYIRHASISTWPSWRQNFLSQLNMDHNYIDPINLLGYCEGHNPITCWNEEKRLFFEADWGDDNIILPAHSFALIYETSFDGSDYGLCSTFETNYNLLEGSLQDMACLVDSYPPELLTNTTIAGEPFKPFSRYIEVYDPDNSPLNWYYDTLETDWSSWHEGLAPSLLDTDNPYIKNLYSPLSGVSNDYNFKLKVEDDISYKYFKADFTIKIATITPSINVNPVEITYDLYPDSPLEFSATIFDQYHNQANPISFLFSQTNILNPNIFNSVNNDATINYSGNTMNIDFSKIFEPRGAHVFPADMTINARLRAQNELYASSIRDFNINIITDPVNLDFVCDPSPIVLRHGDNFDCFLGDKIVPPYFDIIYSGQNLPSSFNVNEIDNKYYLQANNISYSNVGVHSSTITADNDFGTLSTRSLPIRIDSYCGDDIKQTPNTEAIGGPLNDGYEDCDGEAGTTDDPEESGPDLQYGCRDDCSFKPGEEGGGYCGDEYCVAGIEDFCNCFVDCGDHDEGMPETCAYCNHECSSFINNCDEEIFCGNCDIGYKCIESVCDPDGMGNECLPIEYTISYDKNTGTGDLMDNTSAVYDIPVFLNKNTYTKLGYSFDKWNRNAEGTGLSYADEEEVENLTTVDGDTVVLYAIWEANQYEVTLDKQGGSSGDTSVTATYNSPMPSASPPLKTGYNFKGYFDETNGEGTRYYHSGSPMTSARNWDKTSDSTLYAYWEAKTYILYFDANGGEVNPTSKSVTYNEPVGTLPIPTRTGYTFEEWNGSVGGEGITYENDFKYTTDGNKTIYAQWTANNYNVTFKANGGVGADYTQTITFDTSEDLTANTFTRTGYTFAGWNTEAGGGGDSYNDEASFTMNVEGITLYAQWTLNTYTVTYTRNPVAGGTLNTYSREVNHGAIADAPGHTTNAGYTLNNFSIVSGNCAGAFNSATGRCSIVTENLTIRANWILNTYTVSYNANGGSCSPGSRTVSHGDNADEPSCVRLNHTLNSFEIISSPSTNCSGFNSNTGSCNSVIGNVTIQANWRANCSSSNLFWGNNDRCSAFFGPVNHNQRETKNNTNDYHTGSATFSCNNGSWNLSNSNCKSLEWRSICDDSGRTTSCIATVNCRFSIPGTGHSELPEQLWCNNEGEKCDICLRNGVWEECAEGYQQKFYLECQEIIH